MLRKAELGMALVLAGLLLLVPFAGHSQTGGVMDFTGYYQGLQPGAYSMRFAVYDAPTGGARIWPVGADYEVHPLVLVSAGRFTVQLGSQGSPITALPELAYLDVAVCTPAGFTCVDFEPLPARLPVGGFTPYSVDTPLPTTETPAPTETPQGGSASLCWLLAGNTGTVPGVDFLGTTDAVPLEIRVDNRPILRLEPNSMGPNLIGGQAQNSVAAGVYGATISGGGGPAGPHSIAAEFGTVGGGEKNLVSGRYGTIAGGQWNTAGSFATVGGGVSNAATAWASTVAGGQSNAASSGGATVAGGESNEASAGWSTVAGGVSNTASGESSFVGGGQYNTASGDFSFAAGTHAVAQHKGSFVWADSAALDFRSTEDNQFLVRAFGGAIFNVGSSRFGMIVASGRRSFTSALPDPMPTRSSFALVGLNARNEDDAIGIWGHVGGAPNLLRFYGQVGVLATSIAGYGVVGATESATDGLAAGRFDALSNEGATFGVYGHSSSRSDESAGAYFEGKNGVIAQARYDGKALLARVEKTEYGDASGYGVYAQGGDVGVYGEPRDYLTERRTTPTYGVYGKSDSPIGYGVYSEGNCHVEGELTWKPTTGYVSVGPIAFAATAVAPFTYASWREWSPVGARPRADCGVDQYGNYDATTEDIYFAHLQLPHGARLREVAFHYSYGPGSSNAELRLARSDFSGNITFLAKVEAKRGGLSATINHVVDNETGFYYLFAVLDCNTTLRGAVVSYEVSEPY